MATSQERFQIMDDCSIRIQCSEECLNLLEEEFGPAETAVRPTNGIHDVYFHEVRGGGEFELRKIAGMGHPFTGYNTEGDEYSAMCFCSADCKYMETECDFNKEPIIKTRNGIIVEHSLDDLEKYMAHKRKALWMLEQISTPDPKKLTYRDMFEIISKFTEEQLNSDVSIRIYNDEFLEVKGFYYTKDDGKDPASGILDVGHPYISIIGMDIEDEDDEE